MPTKIFRTKAGWGIEFVILGTTNIDAITTDVTTMKDHVWVQIINYGEDFFQCLLGSRILDSVEN